MDIHKNARLTLRRREDLVEHVARGVTLKLAAADFSVTAKTVAKWVHRFRGQGTGAGPPLHHHERGCLTLSGFRRVSTTDLDTHWPRHHVHPSHTNDRALC